MSDAVTITVRVNNQTAAGFRDINGNLRTMDGRFAASANQMQRHGSVMQKTMVDLKASMLSLAPAAVPVAASLAPIVAHTGAAAVAVAAFGAALKPQITSLAAATKAQDQASDAARKYGAGSRQAAEAQAAVVQTLAGMPAATQRAAAAFSNLKEQTRAWSDSMAKFTMQPVEHSFAVLGAILPKLSPMVQSTSTQFDRLMKVAAGGISTGSFDALSKRFSDFANNSLRSATNSAIHFMRVLSEGNTSGPLTKFMEYARAQGPAVKQLLSNLMQALGNIAQGASQAGPGLLTIVNAMAKLVASVPPQLIGNLMQVYAAFKLIKLAGAGISAVGTSFQTLAAKITALKAASAAAGGGIAGLRAAFASLSVAAKGSVIIAGLALLAMGVQKLAQMARGAPPDVDKLTTSLKGLAATGKMTGELKSTFGSMDGYVAKLRRMKEEQAGIDKATAWPKKFLGMAPVLDTMTEKLDDLVNGSKSMGATTDDFKSLDKALTQLASGGHAKEAAAQFKEWQAVLRKGGMSQKDINKTFSDYTNFVADAKYEQDLTTQSMGLFGTAAQAAAEKLNTQKASADALRQSIQALNDVQRQGLGGMIGFEAAIDAAASGAKKYHDVLSMNDGQLSLSNDKQRQAAQLLSDLASKTDEAAAANRESTGSWEGAIGIYQRGREQLVASARAMGLNKDEAAALADQILKIPDKHARIKMDAEDARAGIKAFNAAVKATPGAKSVTLKTLSKSAEAVLESFGYKVTHLKDGRVSVTAKTGGALSGIRNVAGAIAALHSKTISITSIHNIITRSKTYRSVHDITGATGGLFTGKAFRYADGGLVQGPGTGTSDDVPAPWLSNGEFVIKKASVDKYGERMLQAINDGQFEKRDGYAKGGKVKLTKAQQRAREQAKAEADARKEAAGDLSISHFGKMAGYRNSEFRNALGKPDSLGALVSSLNQWRSIIMKSTHGSTESKLLKQLDSAGKQLLKWEKQLNSVTANLGKAKDKLADLKSAASQLKDSVKSNLLSSANITRGASGEGTVTLSSIKSGMRNSRDKVTAFAAALKQLRAKGFSKSIIRQVAEAGIDGGGLETAGALLQASASEVKTMNQTQAEIEKAAGSAGKTTADAVYEKAIKAQEKYVKKLEEQQKKLKESMDRLADRMEKAIEKVFGKHGHGKKAAGGIVGAAASGGLRSSLTWVGEQGPELLDLPAGSRVWSNPDSRRKAAAPWSSMTNVDRRGTSYGYGQQAPQRVQVEVGFDFGHSGAYNAHKLEEALLEMLRRAVRLRGSGDVQLLLGGRHYRQGQYGTVK
ncbi:phage tail protein [Streptomyces sp. 1222.5]|uniref:phage tail protein n=2 Tax=Streptomyces sp. 1222.5 TaxID=1881026 RepID=UPI003EB85918